MVSIFISFLNSKILTLFIFENEKTKRRITGFASAKVGRWVAFTVGGAIILFEIANEQGIIKIDWNKLNQKADKIGDKVQEAVTGEGPKWLDKVNMSIKII